MAKIKNIALLVFGIVLYLCANSINDTGSKRDEVRSIYTSQIGVREATGHNDGPQVEAYLKVCGLNKGYPWCAAFVACTYLNANVPAIKSAYAPNWFPASKVIWVRNASLPAVGRTPFKGSPPLYGDVFGIYFSKKYRIAHVGFIDAWNGKYAMTVEGNTNAAGSREGDGVYRKRRLIAQIYKVSNWIN